jgi:amidase
VAARPVCRPFVAFPAIVANITGGCWSPSVLPIGTHVLGRTGGHATLFSLAGQAERARPWVHRWPAIAWLAEP